LIHVKGPKPGKDWIFPVNLQELIPEFNILSAPFRQHHFDSNISTATLCQRNILSAHHFASNKERSMSLLVQDAPVQESEERGVVNDFAINVASVNGSGSQTSNGILIRTLFKMGIPINGKNLFPSNIQGLPTWYIIRLSKDGFLARRETTEVMVCMNARTVAEDMESVAPGGIIL
jgi:hypothetical protein